MKVLLISANTFKAPYPVYPIGLDYVSGAISDRHQVRIEDMNTLGHIEGLIECIRYFSPDIIGISLRNIDNTDITDPQGFMGQYKTLVSAVKAHTRAPVILGGSGFTIFPKEIMIALDADYGIIGEGERFSLLLDALEKKEDPLKIPGVVTQHSKKDIPEAWNAPLVTPVPRSRDTVDYYLRKGGMLNLQSKRGCPHHCVYCTYPHIEGKRFRLVPPEKVGNTALRLQKEGAKYFFITDATFNSNIGHSISVAKAIKNAGVTIPWGAFFSPVKMPDDYYDLMADAGLKHIEFGTDTMSEKTLVSYRKPFGIDDIFHSHEKAIDARLHVAHFFVLGGPGESRETLEETFINIDRLKKTVLFLFCGMRIYPYTQLFEIAVKNGQITLSDDLFEPVFFKSDDIEESEIVKRVRDRAKHRLNWVTGSGGDETLEITSKMYKKGYSGPLWEYLIR